ncbi:MAG: nucleotide exchange factor GrpE [Bacilli bacterium]|nr:nucleotide exchange factor GrpE [Bacilli bacterium]
MKEKINKETKKVDKTKEQIEKLSADLEHWKNEYYRAYADMQNLRKRVEADHRDAMKYRLEGFVGDLLPILDGFSMALQNEPSSIEMKNFLTGFEYIYRNLVTVLENEGVKEISPKINDKFNPSLMQAVETVVDEKNPDKITKVITKGYMLHEHLVRPAMVIVSVKEKIDDKKIDNSPEMDA